MIKVFKKIARLAYVASWTVIGVFAAFFAWSVYFTAFGMWGVFMWITDIFKVLFSLMDSENGDHEMTFHLIEKIENNTIYFTNGEKLAFRDVDTDVYEIHNIIKFKEKIKECLK